MRISPKLKEANQLLLDGILALSQIQSNGIRIDQKYLLNEMQSIKTKREELLDGISGNPDLKWWKKTYGDRFNLGSDEQLSDVLFNHMGLEPTKKTSSGKPSVDASSLEEMVEETDSELLKTLMQLRKLEKAEGTYISGILRETSDDGYLHPFFHLHTAVTYRSSSSGINFQNIPTRDKDIKRMIRGAFLPRPGHQILEIDFKGAEVSVACCYHKDPAMRDYLLDPTKDMHRDMAKQLYILNDTEWNKGVRQAAKNQFVFPEFYGSYFKQVAPALWKYVILNKCRIGKDADGVDVITHLKKKGIKDMQAFTDHVEKIEDHFWNVRFPVYSEWKEQWMDAYLEKGYFDTYTGFRISGVLSRNDVINYPVQGSAFHCLLWCLIQMQKYMVKNRMASKIIGQIHDSMVIDIHPREKDDILRHAQLLVQKKLPEHWDWIYIPLTIEAEMTGVDEAWLYKKEIDLKQYSVIQ